MPSKMDFRLKIVAGFIILVSFGLIGQLLLFQFRLDPEVASALQVNAGTNQGREVTIQPNRGNIYDRYGRAIAVNRLEYRVGISPAAVSSQERDQVARDLARILELNELDILALLRPNENGIYENVYIPLKSFVPLAVGEELEAAEIPGLVMDPMYLRDYPQGDLMTQIIGFVNYVESQGDARTTGFYGIEAYYQSELAGQSKIRYESDIPLDVTGEDVQIRDGQDLVLTIDRDIQFVTRQVLTEYIEQEREEWGEESSIQGGTIIVMNPRTGEILAMVSYPYFDEEEFKTILQEGQPVTGNDRVTYNPAVSAVYEPGSIFKILTAAAALDIQQPGLNLNWTYYNNGCENRAGVQICDADKQAKAEQTFSQCIIKSLNTCTVRWVEQINRSRWYNYLNEFGFGRTTDIDLNGEVGGRVVMPWDTDWSEANFLQTSFGQGISVTPLQMLTAANAIANDGIIMRPHIVKSRYDGDQIIETVPEAISNPVSPAAAQQVLDLMRLAVYDNESFGKQAQVANYTVAGKTGTAQQLDPVFGYSDTESWASFIGFVPANEPHLSILVMLDNPHDYWGSQTAAPLFAELTSRLVLLLEMPPDHIRGELIESGARPFDRG